jgi:hypothetical protein
MVEMTDFSEKVETFCKSYGIRYTGFRTLFSILLAESQLSRHCVGKTVQKVGDGLKKPKDIPDEEILH